MVVSRASAPAQRLIGAARVVNQVEKAARVYTNQN
jgi:hypothetical protein